MKNVVIKRENGEQIELTPNEVWDAYKKVQHQEDIEGLKNYIGDIDPDLSGNERFLDCAAYKLRSILDDEPTFYNPYDSYAKAIASAKKELGL